MTTIELTERGRRLDATATRYRRRYLDRLLGTFDEGEVAEFAALLTKFATSVRSQPPGDAG
jgi:DNA-binding MarR family transcriptional regulator